MPSLFHAYKRTFLSRSKKDLQKKKSLINLVNSDKFRIFTSSTKDGKTYLNKSNN